MAYRGTYKGRRFRSLMEYSFYRHLEGSGVPIEEIGYESLRIPYRLGKRVRTYILDFVVGARVYEVKPVFRQKGRKFEAKVAAAVEYCGQNGMTYSVVSERDFRVIALKEALADPDASIVVRKKRRRRRKKRR